jgi:hypothetical protein
MAAGMAAHIKGTGVMADGYLRERVWTGEGRSNAVCMVARSLPSLYRFGPLSE